MRASHLLTSVARISDLAERGFEVRPISRDRWSTGDYVAATVTGRPSPLYRVEVPTGRIVEVLAGTKLIGAFGKRAATLEATGDWEAIGEDNTFEALTGAGLFGKALSVAPSLPRLISLRYDGHVQRAGKKVTMRQFVEPLAGVPFTTPVILVIGTSMSAGKTTAGRIIIHELRRAGFTVAGAKLTGAGRYRDVLSFEDAGADTIVDFVDAGLPSTVVSETEFLGALDWMLGRISRSEADILVAEAGASPLEPYNGKSVVDVLGDRICFTMLCASDPYAVLGVRDAFRLTPDIVTGPTANTQAGIDLVRKLTGLTALNVLTPADIPKLRHTIGERLQSRGLGPVAWP